MNATCLIAAHDPFFLQLIHAYSVECGLRVVQAYQMQDVLPLIHRENPVAIFLHTDLPGNNLDIDLLKLIRNDPLASTIPVLLFYSHFANLQPELIALATTGLQEPVSFDAFQNALINVGICKDITHQQPSIANQIISPKPTKSNKKARKKGG